MIIKKFVGKTEEDAINVAKKELGEGVVVMNVKQVKAKGLFAAFRKKLVEVTVALEDEQEKLANQKKEQINAALTATTSRTTEKTLSDEARSIEQKLENLQSLLESQIRAAEKNEPAEESEKTTEKETASELSDADFEDSELTKYTKLIYNTMIDNEVDEKYANQLISEMEKVYKQNLPIDNVLAGIYQRMILKFGKPAPITEAKEGPKVVLFMGPTGVGKTTTIAKLASRYIVEEKKKVALLTADTYRIAAAEQLSTYASILQAPFRIIYTKDELVDSIKYYHEFDYIFVDTAGHSHQNTEQIHAMKDLISAVEEVAEKQTYLVLSATTKYSDLRKIADKYTAITNYHLIFTKVDETFCVGSMYNLRMHTGASIAYVTSGQNVPDDIETFNPQSTVKQLLGGKLSKEA
ncbi:MAG: flagellar biosynthesis protein FlhF [Lachnospiraceae bacterium]|nr:flagellar biosynthesis protein FlhF [Lachnospiraceae bacterium]